MRKKPNNSRLLTTLLLVALLVFSGCTKKEQAPPSSAPSAAKPAVKVQPPVQKQSTSAQGAVSAETRLDFTNRKDPFKPFDVIPPLAPQKASPAVVAKLANLLPIQSFEVNKFTVSGIIVGLKENTALVVDPTGRGYVVKEGMPIGSSDGRISRIRPSSIEVVEPYRDDKGHHRKRTIMLTLRKK
jgi:type IV pilus assembly protein PilP